MLHLSTAVGPEADTWREIFPAYSHDHDRMYVCDRAGCGYLMYDALSVGRARRYHDRINPDCRDATRPAMMATVTQDVTCDVD